MTHQKFKMPFGIIAKQILADPERNEDLKDEIVTSVSD